MSLMNFPSNRAAWTFESLPEAVCATPPFFVCLPELLTDATVSYPVS